MSAATELAAAQARIAELEAAILAKTAGTITMKVAENSGMISVYGFGKNPLNFYAEQVDRLILDPDQVEKLREFRNRPDVVALLSFKLDSAEEKAAKALLRKASKAPFVQHPKAA